MFVLFECKRTKLKKGNFKRRRFSGSVWNFLFGQNPIFIYLAILLLILGGVPQCRDTKVQSFTAVVIKFVDSKQDSNFRDVKHRSLCIFEAFIQRNHFWAQFNPRQSAKLCYCAREISQVFREDVKKSTIAKQAFFYFPYPFVIFAFRSSVLTCEFMILLIYIDVICRSFLSGSCSQGRHQLWKIRKKWGGGDFDVIFPSVGIPN